MVNGDIYIENGDLKLVNGQEELRQNIENRLSVNKNEWYLNIRLGLSYKDIRGKNIPDRQIKLAIRECCFQDKRVKAVDINSIERDDKNRKVYIDITIIDKDDEEIYMKGVIV